MGIRVPPPPPRDNEELMQQIEDMERRLLRTMSHHILAILIGIFGVLIILMELAIRLPAAQQ